MRWSASAGQQADRLSVSIPPPARQISASVSLDRPPSAIEIIRILIRIANITQYFSATNWDLPSVGGWVINYGNWRGAR